MNLNDYNVYTFTIDGCEYALLLQQRYSDILFHNTPIMVGTTLLSQLLTRLRAL